MASEIHIPTIFYYLILIMVFGTAVSLLFTCAVRAITKDELRVSNPMNILIAIMLIICGITVIGHQPVNPNQDQDTSQNAD